MDLKSKTDNWREINSKRIYFSVAPADLVDVVTILFNERNYRFITASGTDLRDSMEVLYHFSDDSDGTVYTARVTVDKKRLSLPTITGVVHGASWIEREIHELLGIDFPGNDNLKHLLLADDWPQGNYPLRQDNEPEAKR